MHRNKASKLDKHKQLIAQKLKIKGDNVKAHNLRPMAATKGHPRYETDPGIQA